MELTKDDVKAVGRSRWYIQHKKYLYAGMIAWVVLLFLFAVGAVVSNPSPSEYVYQNGAGGQIIGHSNQIIADNEIYVLQKGDTSNADIYFSVILLVVIFGGLVLYAWFDKRMNNAGEKLAETDATTH